MVRQIPVTFPSAEGHALQLEGVLHSVDGDGPLPAAVICHPHPLGGGSMHNGVVMAIARTLASRGVLTLRFNFRGVGSSEGAHDDGRGERNDLAGAIDWLLAQPIVDPRRVSLVGYSFGACVGLAHAHADPRVSAFAGVGLAVEFCDSDATLPFSGRRRDASGPETGSFTCPKLFITGERDQLAPPEELLELVERLPAPKIVQIVPGADHFWWSSEREVAERVAEFVTGLKGNP